MAKSMIAFATVCEYLGKHTQALNSISMSDRNVTLVAVADGLAPRPATLSTFHTQWNYVSIDPMMRRGAWDENVTNLRTHAARVQDCVLPIRRNANILCWRFVIDQHIMLVLRH